MAPLADTPNNAKKTKVMAAVMRAKRLHVLRNADGVVFAYQSVACNSFSYLFSLTNKPFEVVIRRVQIAPEMIKDSSLRSD